MCLQTEKKREREKTVAVIYFSLSRLWTKKTGCKHSQGMVSPCLFSLSLQLRVANFSEGAIINLGGKKC